MRLLGDELAVDGRDSLLHVEGLLRQVHLAEAVSLHPWHLYILLLMLEAWQEESVNLLVFRALKPTNDVLTKGHELFDIFELHLCRIVLQEKQSKIWVRHWNVNYCVGEIRMGSVRKLSSFDSEVLSVASHCAMIK